MKRIRLLQLKYLFSWQVFGLSSIWALFLHFADTATNEDSHYLIRVIIVLLLQLMMFGTIYILAQPFSYRTRPSLQPVILLVIVMVAATTRGALLGLALRRFAFSESYPVFNRAMSSLSNMTLQITLSTIVFASIRTHNTRKIRLISENDHLTMLTSAANGSLSLMGEQTAEPIRQELLSVVSALPANNSKVTLEVLKATIDEVVRPLSHALESELTWQPPVIPRRQARFNWKRALADAAVPKFISPPWILFGLMVGLIPNLLYEVGIFKGLFFALHASAFGFALFLLAKLISTGVVTLTKSDSAQTKRVLFFITLGLAGLALGEYARLFLQGESTRTRFLVLAPVATIIVGTLVAILNSIFAKVDAIERELKENAEDLSWTLAKTREIRRHAERTLANILHGKVQAAFAAAFLRVEMEVDAGNDSSAAIINVKKNLTDFLNKLDFSYAIPEALAVTVSRIRTTWLGVSEITFSVEPELEQQINLDIFCLTTLNDILPELCFNSIKHGKATKIAISIIRQQQRVIEVVVVDNGTADLFELRVGMGTRLLNDCAIRWSRERVASDTVIKIVLPIGDDVLETLSSQNFILQNPKIDK